MYNIEYLCYYRFFFVSNTNIKTPFKIYIINIITRLPNE